MDQSRFRLREATKEDVPEMVDVFFHSFNAPFWQHFVPDNAYMRKWFTDALEMGIDNPTDRNFVIEDTHSNGRIAAFSRWMAPQDDGNQERKWPEMDEKEFDMEVAGAFFGGMEANHEHLMGKRPHWFLELLGTHDDYQRNGLGSELIHWGTNQADKQALETYLDASEKGRPFYLAHHDFKLAGDIDIPDRPSYGHFHYVSVIRQPREVV